MYGKIWLSPTNLNIQIHDLNTTRWVWYTTLKLGPSSEWNVFSRFFSRVKMPYSIHNNPRNRNLCRPFTSLNFRLLQKKRYEHSKSHSSTVKASSSSIQGTPSMSLTPPKSWANFSCFVRSLAGHVGSEATEYHHGISSCLVMFSDVYWIIMDFNGFKWI